ncbi:MAG: type ISP restriction/modification enzyme [Trueperaceae bacterium]|nr:type ISP restriction/modification enzyme [Trueperaceae bacterium]
MTSKPKAKVYRADLYGLREGKYDYLRETDISKTKWTEVSPKSPFYLFTVSQSEEFFEEYQAGWKITDISPLNSVGVVTSRDKFAIGFTRDEVANRMKEFCQKSLSDIEVSKRFSLKDTGTFKVSSVRETICKTEWEDNILDYNYRPFDSRHIIFSDEILERSRKEVMQHLAHDNISLIFMRQVALDNVYSHFLATEAMADARAFYSNKGIINQAPLYLYPDESSNNVFDQPTSNPGGRRPNLAPEFIEDVAGRLGLAFVDDGRGDLTSTFGPEDVFHYIYAVFHAPSYRERYAEFLKIDFPRVPLTQNLELFRSLAAKGERLVALHLMERTGNIMTSYPEDGDNVVDKPRFKEDEGGETGRVYINETQYFGGVPSAVWAFYVGGYQVLHKWLKDRKGRELSYNDLRHYQRIVAALSETIDTMSEIDETIDEAGGWPLA